MGNRAYIVQSGKHTGVYLHWNGGRDSVEAFLKYCELKGHRGFETSYGLARFCQVVGNYFGGSNSIGIETDIYPDAADSVDNGIYSVKGWQIVNRFYSGQEQQEYKLQDMLRDIDEAQPEEERFGSEYWDAETVKTGDIQPGDTVFYIDPLDGRVYKTLCVGIGWDHNVNGRGVNGVPFIDRFGKDFTSCEKNPNNYLWDKSYQVIRRNNQ